MIIPALDLLDGQVVRLYQGDFAQKTVYSDHPLELALAYQESGAQLLHLVDLQGAKNPQARQLELLKHLSYHLRIPLQVGGGIRSKEDIQKLLATGVERVVVGSAAVKNPYQAAEWLAEFGEKHLTLALDIRLEADKAYLLTHGWQQQSTRTLDDFMQEFHSYGLLPHHILCTDIARDGTMTGANTALYRRLLDDYPQQQWQASGGVDSLENIRELAQAGVAGVILGKSLLVNAFSLEEAQAVWQEVHA